MATLLVPFLPFCCFKCCCHGFISVSNLLYSNEKMVEQMSALKLPSVCGGKWQ